MQDKRIGPWAVGAVRAAFDNPWISVVDHDVTHPDGTPGRYGVVKFKNLAIGVLPIAKNGDVWLVGQHRFPLDVYSWELPEGGGPVDTRRSLRPSANWRRRLALAPSRGSRLRHSTFQIPSRMSARYVSSPGVLRKAWRRLNRPKP